MNCAWKINQMHFRREKVAETTKQKQNQKNVCGFCERFRDFPSLLFEVYFHLF